MEKRNKVYSTHCIGMGCHLSYVIFIAVCLTARTNWMCAFFFIHANFCVWKMFFSHLPDELNDRTLFT